MALQVGKDFPIFTITKGLHSGEALNKIAGNLGSFASVTAAAGGGKANATALNAVNVILATVANANDSVLLPRGYAGLTIEIFNSTVTSAQIFGFGTDTINGVATGTGVALAGGATAMYRCIGVTAAGVGLWNRFVSA